MALYHLSAKVISRSAGRSAVAAAAYRSGERLTNERDGQCHDYSRRKGVEHAEVMAPDNAPDWMRDRERLWNAVEAVEKRKDSQLAREVEVALPRELTHEQRVGLVREFVAEEFVSRGMVADVAIHCPLASDGQEQPHAHVLLTTREIIPHEGFGGKARDWNRTEALEGWREKWAEHQNRALERAGQELRVDHRSLEAQRAEALEIANDNGRAAPERQQAGERAAALDREPQPKLGAAAAAMERRGIETERGDQGREVGGRNAERADLRQRLQEIGTRVAELGREIAGKARDMFEGLDLSGSAKSLKEVVFAGFRPVAGSRLAELRQDLAHDQVQTPAARYGRSLAAFERSARDIEGFRKDGLVETPSMQDHHLKLHAEMRQNLRAWAREEPERAWGAAGEIEKRRPKVGRDLKKEIALDIGKDKQVMLALAKRSPEISREIKRELSRERDIGLSR